VSLLDRLRRPAAAAPVPAPDLELRARRDRLVERFALMQADLGGLYYEMAIRDHVRPDVLSRKAAELQAVELELRAVERLLQSGDGLAEHPCPTCSAPAGRSDAFCAHCGGALSPRVNGVVG
jgi:hypothetical protein